MPDLTVVVGQDMLVGSSPQAAVHNTPDQARTQFSLWAVMAAPLLIGSNILNISVPRAVLCLCCDVLLHSDCVVACADIRAGV